MDKLVRRITAVRRDGTSNDVVVVYREVEEVAEGLRLVPAVRANRTSPHQG